MKKLNTDTESISQNAERTDNFDFSKGEETVRNIVLPNSQFGAKWVKDEGFAIGIENIKITESYDTLEKALNKIGYGVDRDDDGDEILVKEGGIDYEIIVRIVRALLIVHDENAKEELKQIIETLKP